LSGPGQNDQDYPRTATTKLRGNNMQLLEYHERPIDGHNIIAWGVWDALNGSNIICDKCGRPETEDPDPLMSEDFEPDIAITCDICGRKIA